MITLTQETTYYLFYEQSFRKLLIELSFISRASELFVAYEKLYRMKLIIIFLGVN